MTNYLIKKKKKKKKKKRYKITIIKMFNWVITLITYLYKRKQIIMKLIL